MPIAQRETVKLRKQIAELPKNSVVIKDAGKDLDQQEDGNFWTHLNHDKINFLRTTIKPLLRTISVTDFKAMCFEKDVVETSLAKLAGEKQKYEALKDE